jgi:hypothetical protein
MAAVPPELTKIVEKSTIFVIIKAVKQNNNQS